MRSLKGPIGSKIEKAWCGSAAAISRSRRADREHKHRRVLGRLSDNGQSYRRSPRERELFEKKYFLLREKD